MSDMRNPIHYEETVVSFGAGIISDVKSDIQHETGNKHNYVLWAVNYRPDKIAQSFVRRSGTETVSRFNLTDNGSLGFINNPFGTNFNTINIPIELVGTLELYKYWNIFYKRYERIYKRVDPIDGPTGPSGDDDFKPIAQPTEDFSQDGTREISEYYFQKNVPVYKPEEAFFQIPLSYFDSPYNVKDPILKKYTKIIYLGDNQFKIIEHKENSLGEIKDLYTRIFSYNMNGLILYDEISDFKLSPDHDYPKFLKGHKCRYETNENNEIWATIEYRNLTYKLYSTQIELYGAVRYEVNRPTKTGNLFIFCNKKHSTSYTLVENDAVQEEIDKEEEAFRIFDLLIDYDAYVKRYRKYCIDNKLWKAYIPYVDKYVRTKYYKGEYIQVYVNELKIINQYNTGEQDLRYKFSDLYFFRFGKGRITYSTQLKNITNSFDSQLGFYLKYKSEIVYSVHNLPISIDSPVPAPQIFKVYGLMNNHIKNGNAIYVSTIKNDLEKEYIYNAPVNCYYYENAMDQKYVFMPYDIKSVTWSGWKWRYPSKLYSQLIGEVHLHLPKRYRLSPYIFNFDKNNAVRTSNYKNTKYLQFFYEQKKLLFDVYRSIQMDYQSTKIRVPIIDGVENYNSTHLITEGERYSLSGISNDYGDKQKEKGQYDYAEFDKATKYLNSDYIYVKNSSDTSIDIMFWMTDQLPYPDDIRLRNKALMDIPIEFGKSSNRYSLCDVILPFKRYSDMLNQYILTIESLNHDKEYWIPYQSIKYPMITKTENHHIALIDMIFNRKKGIMNIDPSLIYAEDGYLWYDITQGLSDDEIKELFNNLTLVTTHDALYYPLSTVNAKIKYNNTKESVNAEIVPALQNVCRGRSTELATQIEIAEDELNENDFWMDLHANDYENLVRWREVIGTLEIYRVHGIPTMSATAFMLPNYKANYTPRYWLRGEEIPYLITGVVDGIEIEFKRGVYVIPSSNEFIRFKHPAFYMINYIEAPDYRILHYVSENSMMNCNPNSIMYAYHPFAWSNVVPSTKTVKIGNPPHMMNTLNNKLKKNGLHKLFSFDYEYEDNGEYKQKSTKYGQFTFYPMWQRLPFLCFTLVLNYSSLEEAINDLPSGLTQIKLYIAEASSESIISRDIRGKEASVFEEGYARHNLKANKNGYRLVKTFTIKNSPGDRYNDGVYKAMVSNENVASNTNSWLRVQDYTSAINSKYQDDPNFYHLLNNRILSSEHDYIRKRSFIIAIPYIEEIDQKYDFKDFQEVNDTYKEYALNFRNDTDICEIYNNIVKWTPDFYLWDYPQQSELAIDNLQGMGEQLWEGIGAKYVATIKNAFIIIEGQSKNGDIETGRVRVSLNQNGKFSFDMFREWDFIDVCTEEITSFAVFKDNLIIFTKQAIYLVVFQDITNGATWYVANKIDHPGALHEKNVAVSENGVFFCNRTGVYLTDGIEVTKISTPIQQYYERKYQDIARKITNPLPRYRTDLRTETLRTVDKNAKVIIAEDYYSIDNSIELLYNNEDRCLYVIWNDGYVYEFVYNTELKTWHIENYLLLNTLKNDGQSNVSLSSSGSSSGEFSYIAAAPQGFMNFGYTLSYVYNNVQYYINYTAPCITGYIYTSLTDVEHNGIMYYLPNSYGLLTKKAKENRVYMERPNYIEENVPLLLRSAYIYKGKRHRVIKYTYKGIITPSHPFSGYGFNVENYLTNLNIFEFSNSDLEYKYLMYASSYGYQVVNEIMHNDTYYDNLQIMYPVFLARPDDIYGNIIVRLGLYTADLKIQSKFNMEILTHDITNGINYYTFDNLIIELGYDSKSEVTGLISFTWSAIQLDNINFLPYKGLINEQISQTTIKVPELPAKAREIDLDYTSLTEYKLYDDSGQIVGCEVFNNIRFGDTTTYNIRILPRNMAISSRVQLNYVDVIARLVRTRWHQVRAYAIPVYDNNGKITKYKCKYAEDIGTPVLIHRSIRCLIEEGTSEQVITTGKASVEYSSYSDYYNNYTPGENDDSTIYRLAPDGIPDYVLNYPIYFMPTNRDYVIHISSYCLTNIECIKLKGRIYEKSNYS